MATSPGLFDPGPAGEVLGISTEGLLFNPAPSIIFDGDEGAILDAVTVADNGAVQMTLTTGFALPIAGILVEVTDSGHTWFRACYSGVIGNGGLCYSLDLHTLNFILPPLPIGGPYGVRFTPDGGVAAYWPEDVITVVHRPFSTTLFSLRSAFAPPRNVGPRSIRNAD